MEGTEIQPGRLNRTDSNLKCQNGINGGSNSLATSKYAKSLKQAISPRSHVIILYGVRPRRGGYGPLLWQPPRPGGPVNRSETKKSRKQPVRGRCRRKSSELLPWRSADALRREIKEAWRNERKPIRGRSKVASQNRKSRRKLGSNF